MNVRASSPLRFVLVMGVAGSGKTSVGRALASRLGWDFFDADRLHPAANIAKMEQGIPLNDTDRAPWLHTVRKLIIARLEAGRPGVLACSALKERYRKALLAGTSGVAIVYLEAGQEVVRARLAGREGHYMHPGLLPSQFEALEEPEGAIVVDASLPIARIVDLAAGALERRSEVPRR